MLQLSEEQKTFLKSLLSSVNISAGNPDAIKTLTIIQEILDQLTK